LPHHLFEHITSGLFLLLILGLFVACLTLAIVECFRPGIIVNPTYFDPISRTVVGLVLSVASFRRVTMPRRSRAAHPAIATTTSPSSFPASPPIPIEHPVGAAPQRPRSGKDRNLVAARNRTASPSVP